MVLTNKKHNRLFICVILLAGMLISVSAQVVTLSRGRLWHGFHFAQECAPLADWRPMSYGLDWPGYSIKEMSTNIGGTYTYMITGGFFISALRTISPDTVQGWMDFCVNGDRNTSLQKGEKHFFSSKHEKYWKNGENYYLTTDPNEAEEMIVSVWEKDPQFSDYNTENKKFNIKTTRTVRQWSGSQADEDYVILEYQIESIPTELNGLDSAVVLFSYGLSPTDRGWNFTNPNYVSGARNTYSEYDSVDQLVTVWAGDYRNTVEDESFDYFEYLVFNSLTRENEVEHEFMAPGVVGIKVLEISLNDSPLNYQFVWTAAPPSSDYEGPFSGVAGFENKYAAMKNPLLLNEAFTDPEDDRIGDSRLYANFAIGPFNLRGRGRGSLKVVIAQFVGGADLATAQRLELSDKDIIKAKGDSAVAYLNERVKFNYDHDYCVPMPPPGPEFNITPFDTIGRVGNIISFTDSIERVLDPHQGIVDVAGYRIYRSAEYPFGPWEKIADIPVQSTKYWNIDSAKYFFRDESVALGYGYYYSVTSYDCGHDHWAVDNAVSVPSLESSIFANRSKSKFYTTLFPLSEGESLDKIVVVPNPFYMSSGLQSAADQKLIQFVNVPTRCTIRIFTLRGDLVKTIQHDNPSSGVATWNQISDNNQYVKSGMYFYHVKSESGETRGKFAIVN